MFFIPYELYLYGMFLMKRDVFRAFRSWVDPATRSESLLLFKINVFRPAAGLAVPLTSLDHSRALGGGRDEVGLGSLFYLLAAAATTKSGPRR